MRRARLVHSTAEVTILFPTRSPGRRTRRMSWMSLARATLVTALASGLGCSLATSVEIKPLRTVQSLSSDAPARLPELFQTGQYLAVIERAEEATTASDQLLVARAELYAMRLDRAEARLQRILANGPSGSTRRNALWAMSRIAELRGDSKRTIEYAYAARDAGLRIRGWFIELHEALVSTDTYSLSGAVQTTLPMKIVSPDLPLVEARSGSARVASVIDSGAALSIISESVAGRLDLDPLDGITGEVSGLLGSRVRVEFGLIRQLHLGDVVISNIPVAVIPDHRLRFRTTEGDFDIEFLIGTDLLRRFRITLDPARETVTVRRIEALLPAPDQNLFLHEGRPMVAVALEGSGWYPMIIDTGSEVTFLNQANPLVGVTLSRLPRFHSVTMQFLDGVRSSGSKVERITLGVDRWAGRFSDLPLYGDSRTSNLGILGQNFLSRFRTTIDYGTMRVELEPLD